MWRLTRFLDYRSSAAISRFSSLFLFPWGFQSRAAFRMSPYSFLNVWPIHLNFQFSYFYIYIILSCYLSIGLCWKKYFPTIFLRYILDIYSQRFVFYAGFPLWQAKRVYFIRPNYVEGVVAIQHVIYNLVVFDSTEALPVFTQQPHRSVTLSPSDCGFARKTYTTFSEQPNWNN